jgi:hypothetical protein
MRLAVDHGQALVLCHSIDHDGRRFPGRSSGLGHYTLIAPSYHWSARILSKHHQHRGILVQYQYAYILVDLTAALHAFMV